MKPLLIARNLSIGYRSGKRENSVADLLNLDLFTGQLVCLLGPNGAGKSTLMRTISGLQPALAGEITIDDQPLQHLNPGELAKKLSLVLTERVESGNLSVEELVGLGRTPYTGWLGNLTNADRNKIRQSMEETDTLRYAARKMNALSDGERQKVMLARALSQDTALILLDEPTAHLDLPNRVEMMRLLHHLARQTNKAILLSTHELDLALQAADRLWLLDADGKLATGTPEDLVLNGNFEAAFTRNGFLFDRQTGTFTIHKNAFLLPVYLSGPAHLTFWTKRALEREGFETSTDSQLSAQIEIVEKEEKPLWIFHHQNRKQEYQSIGDLLSGLQFLKAK